MVTSKPHKFYQKMHGKDAIVVSTRDEACASECSKFHIVFISVITVYHHQFEIDLAYIRSSRNRLVGALSTEVLFTAETTNSNQITFTDAGKYQRLKKKKKSLTQKVYVTNIFYNKIAVAVGIK